ncbi:MAG: hypothetical protein SOY47_16010 [Lachnospiraceae bacterium]|nr:hypothetical protein [Lachnospiraceae bacterium]
MRLIDADKLKDTLLEYNYTTAHSQIFRYIDEQPTAYDPDKVAERLIKDSAVKLYGSNNSNNYLIPIKRAIEIVKGGGVNE